MKFDDIIKQVEDNLHSAFFYTPSVYKKAISYHFLKPFEIISVNKKEELDIAFKIVQKLIDRGYYGYSLIKYEAGFLFEEKLSHLLSSDYEKLIQFFFFNKRNVNQLKSSEIITTDFSNDKYTVKNFKLNRSEKQFFDDIKKIKNYIKEGDTYQVNYTVKGKFSFSGSCSAFFENLLFNQSAKYSAFINNNKEIIISVSPELFFHQRNRNIVSHPMKGTTRRGHNQNLDKIAETELMKSEKNCAENVMIVDLIRNDLGRICRYGSIQVPELFTVEKYESLFQMVSQVSGKLRKKIKHFDIIQNIFPCGSVTGAPKIRTMEIINKIENNKRGIYTGSIGLIEPEEFKMSVAIRTITINKQTGDGIMGLGSGIVWDSNPKSEYEEVLLKSKFLTEPLNYFEIFETMRYENGQIKFIDDHIERMKTTADYFLFKFNEKKIRKQIDKSIADLDKQKIKKIRLSLAKWGEIRVNVSDIEKPAKDISVIISQNKINSSDKFRYFKTTNRKLYDDEYKHFSSKGFFDVLYLNEKDEIAEGSRTNIFFRKGTNWFTPAIESGLLPGVYRKYFIETHPDISEKNIRIEDLINADELLITNALRGELKVDKLFINSEEYVAFAN
jgi:para-aminobenzoate synthetase / 4-amino-4-deoxychorismate lyase